MKNDINFEIGIGGYFKIEAGRLDEHGIEHRRVLADWFPNLILNGGLDLIPIYGAGALRYALVGSGSSTPQNNQSSLDSFIASTGTISTYTFGVITDSPRYGWRRNTYQFAQGAAAGNITEVGIGSDYNNNGLFSRSLIKDSNGNPTSVTVLDNEILYITYELRCYIPENDVTATINISGTNYQVTIRAWGASNSYYWGYYLPDLIQGRSAYMGASNGTDLSPIDSNYLTGNYDTHSADWVTSGYTPGSYYLDMSGTFPIDYVNFANGVSVFGWSTGIGAYQFKVTPPLAKDNTKTLSLTVRTSWARYNP